MCLYEGELFKEINFEAQNDFWTLGPQFSHVETNF